MERYIESDENLNEGGSAETEPEMDFDKLERTAMSKALKTKSINGKDLEMIHQYAEGKLNPKDEGKFMKARNLWWKDEFGFPYNSQLKTGVLAAMEKNSGDMVAVEVMKKTVAFFENEKNLNDLARKNKGKWNDEMRDIVREITKFRGNIGNLIETNSSDKEVCRELWETIERLANESGSGSQVESLKKSTLSQIAASLGFKEIGLEPTQVAPEIDAFEMIDLQVGENVLQIKSSQTSEGILIASSDEIASNGVVLRGDKITMVHVDGEKYRTKIAHYKSNMARMGHAMPQIEGYVIVIPPSEYDQHTGKPSDKFVQKLKEIFGKKD